LVPAEVDQEHPSRATPLGHAAQGTHTHAHTGYTLTHTCTHRVRAHTHDLTDMHTNTHEDQSNPKIFDPIVHSKGTGRYLQGTLRV
jgi:hypothetical protein